MLYMVSYKAQDGHIFRKAKLYENIELAQEVLQGKSSSWFIEEVCETAQELATIALGALKILEEPHSYNDIAHELKPHLVQAYSKAKECALKLGNMQLYHSISSRNLCSAYWTLKEYID